MLGAALPGLLACTRCPRLARFRQELPPRGGRGREEYWGRPVPGFGDPLARICLVGLAPGAHGANRTGRPFTGDGAGDFMYPLLHAAGYASQADAVARADGLSLSGLYISNAVKCVPPENKPAPSEFAACRPYLAMELAALQRLTVVLALGQGAWHSLLLLLQEQGEIRRLGEHPFAHGAAFRTPRGVWYVASYHTSRYNLQTGRITAAMFTQLLERVGRLARGESG